jgi:hypothetical protein
MMIHWLFLNKRAVFKKTIFIFLLICHPDVENNEIFDHFDLRCLSITRKTMRDYNDNLEDGVFEDRDRGPCQTCKRLITKECDGLIHELERLNNLHLVSAGDCQCKYIASKVLHSKEASQTYTGFLNFTNPSNGC